MFRVSRRLLVSAAILSFALGASGRPATPATRECAGLVKACRAAGFVPGRRNRHKGQGLWAGCVRPLARGKKVAGVKGVSKKAAALCLKSRHEARKGKR
jgi:hypothetical protein